MLPKNLVAIVSILWSLSACAAAPKSTAPGKGRAANRVASVLVAEDFLNEVFKEHLKSEIVPELKVSFDPSKARITFQGIMNVPVEEMRAINLDPSLGSFRFQVGVSPSVNEQGHLRLEFPVNETYFYPAKSKNPKQDRVVVPVQMLSVALASARGYLAALSGDFSGFDRREAKMRALMKDLDREISKSNNPDETDELKTQREELRLKLESVPLERKQLTAMGKQIGKILGFSGEKDVDLNNELGAEGNAVILKIKLSQIVPYLKGVDLGGVRVVDGMLAVDINSNIDIPRLRSANGTGKHRENPKYKPAITVRLSQRLFETEAVKTAEATGAASKIRGLQFDFRDDGLHVSGGYKVLLVTIPFDTTVDFYSTSPDHFDVRLRSLSIAGLDMDYLKKVALDSIRTRLDSTFPGVCQFENVQDGPERILKVSVDAKALVPAFPNLHLVDVDVRDRFFLMKVGKVDP